MKFVMQAFYRALGEAGEPDRFGFVGVPVEIREIEADAAPVALRHHVAGDMVGLAPVAVDYRMVDGTLLASTRLDRAWIEMLLEDDPDQDWSKVFAIEGLGCLISRSDRGRDALRHSGSAEDEARDGDFVAYARREAERFAERSAMIDGVLWAPAPAPELVVLPPAVRRNRGGKAAKLLAAETIPFAGQHRVHARYAREGADGARVTRPVVSDDEYRQALIDDRVFRFDEFGEARTRALSIAPRVWSPDRFELFDPQAVKEDPSTSATRKACEKLVDICSAERHPAFADPAFRAAISPLADILASDDLRVRWKSGVELAPYLRTAMAAFGADLALADLAREEPYATLLDMARRTHDRTMERLRTGRTRETLWRTEAERLAGEDDAALGSLAP